MTHLRRTIKRAVSDFIVRHASPTTFQLGEILTRPSSRARAFLLREMLAHWKSDWRHRALFEKFEARLPSRAVISAIAEIKYSRNSELCNSLDRLTIPEWLSTPIDFTLRSFDPPTSPFSYAPLRIVPYCHHRGILPTLYFADFYLGDVAYQSAHYDPKNAPGAPRDHTRSYLLHDVYFTHAALQMWCRNEVIEARGRLAELLDLDGRSFAHSIQQRWGKRNNP